MVSRVVRGHMVYGSSSSDFLYREVGIFFCLIRYVLHFGSGEWRGFLGVTKYRWSDCHGLVNAFGQLVGIASDPKGFVLVFPMGRARVVRRFRLPFNASV